MPWPDVVRLWKADLQNAKNNNTNELLVLIREARWNCISAGEDWMTALEEDIVAMLVFTDNNLDRMPPTICRDISELLGLPRETAFVRGTEGCGDVMVVYLAAEAGLSFNLDVFLNCEDLEEAKALKTRFLPVETARSYTADACITGDVGQVAQVADRIGLGAFIRSFRRFVFLCLLFLCLKELVELERSCSCSSLAACSRRWNFMHEATSAR